MSQSCFIGIERAYDEVYHQRFEWTMASSHLAGVRCGKTESLHAGLWQQSRWTCIYTGWSFNMEQQDKLFLDHRLATNVFKKWLMLSFQSHLFYRFVAKLLYIYIYIYIIIYTRARMHIYAYIYVSMTLRRRRISASGTIFCSWRVTETLVTDQRPLLCLRLLMTRAEAIPEDEIESVESISKYDLDYINIYYKIVNTKSRILHRLKRPAWIGFNWFINIINELVLDLAELTESDTRVYSQFN